MQGISEAIVSTRTDLERLQTIHKLFVFQINKGDQPQSPVWSLKFVEGDLRLKFLDHEFRAAPRSVVLDSRFAANEYAFVGSLGGKEHVLLGLDLLPDGGLFINSKLDAGSRICDYNNTYVVNKILSKIHEAAMSSPLFAPIG